jgi:hypothetical protein
MNNLDRLLAPFKIKSLEISNRIVMPPMGTQLGNDDCTVSEANLAYMKRRQDRLFRLRVSGICRLRCMAGSERLGAAQR